jgi:hypothetical protein
MSKGIASLAIENFEFPEVDALKDELPSFEYS